MGYTVFKMSRLQQNGKPCTSFRAETPPLCLASHNRMLSKQRLPFRETVHFVGYEEAFLKPSF